MCLGVDEGGVATGYSVLNSLVLIGSNGPEADDLDAENSQDEENHTTGSSNSDWNWNAQNFDELQKLFVDIVRRGDGGSEKNQKQY